MRVIAFATIFAAGLMLGGATAQAAENPIAIAQKALKGGKTDLAIRALNAALAGGSLKGADVARAYLYRGLAAAKAGKKAEAMADLSQALYMKGLGDAERREAESARSAIYKDAGLASPEPSQAPAPAAVATAAAAPAPQAEVVSAFKTATEVAPEAPVPKPKKKPVAAAQTTSPPAVEAARAPVLIDEIVVSGTDPASGGEALPWGGDEAVAAEPASAPSRTWSTEAQSTKAQSTKAQATKAQATKAKSTEVKAASGKPAKAKSAALAKGTIYMQVASLRSQAEAEAFAGRLSSEQADALGGAGTRIEPVVLGNMGTFYSVRVGPVATKAAGNTLCAKLRGKGVDCWLATP